MKISSPVAERTEDCSAAKSDRPLSCGCTNSPSMIAVLASSLAAASAMGFSLSVQSWPRRVKTRTSPFSM